MLPVKGFNRSQLFQSGSVAVNHVRLWILRQQFESAPDYSLILPLFSKNKLLYTYIFHGIMPETPQ